jgi:hypothetical protein
LIEDRKGAPVAEFLDVFLQDIEAK